MGITGRVPEAFLPILAELEANAVHYFGKPVTSLQPVRMVAGRYSRVLRLRVEAGDRSTWIFVKHYHASTHTPEEAVRFRRYVVREFERTTLASRYATPSAGVVRIIACLPDHFALVTEEAEGVRLDRLFRQLALVRTKARTERVQRALTQVARWIRDFQAGVPVVKTRVRDYRRYIDIRLQEMIARQQAWFGEADRAAVLAFFDAQHARLRSDDLALVPLHGDLCPSNILARDDGVTILDMATSDDGTRYHDLTHLLFHVELAGRRFGFGRTLVQRLTRALLDGFEPGLDSSTPLLRILLLQHAICHLADLSLRWHHPPHALRAWRSRNQIAWCLEVAGVRAPRQGWRADAQPDLSGAPHHREVISDECPQGCVPRPVEQRTKL
jgi:Ser/Thr protein kinase RdoA (MazF antagonist)